MFKLLQKYRGGRRGARTGWAALLPAASPTKLTRQHVVRLHHSTAIPRSEGDVGVVKKTVVHVYSSVCDGNDGVSDIDAGQNA